MLLRTGLFVAVFALIAKDSRTFLFDLMATTTEKIQSAAPMSYAVLGVLAMAGVASLFLVENGALRRGPKDPIAKYRKGVWD